MFIFKNLLNARTSAKLSSFARNTGQVILGSTYAHHGSFNMTGGVLPELSVNGTAHIKAKTQIKGKTRINGTFRANDVTLNDLSVNGNAYLEDTKVEGNVDIHGSLEAVRSIFHIIKFCGRTLPLRFCKAESIVIEKAGNYFNPSQFLELSDSEIMGNVIFESGKGHVTLQNSKIHGKIIGATVDQIASNIPEYK